MTEGEPSAVAVQEEPAFDDLIGEVLPGSSMVARMPGVVVVLRRAAAEGAGGSGSPGGAGESGGTDADRAVTELLDLVRAASRQAAPGRDLARALTEFVVRARAVPDFCTVAATVDGIAVFLRGDVSVAELPPPAGGAAGERLQLSGRTAAFTVDRLLPRPAGPLQMTVGSARDRSPSAVAPPAWSGLVQGLVPGDGIVLHRPGVAAGRHAAQPPASAPAVDRAGAAPAVAPDRRVAAAAEPTEQQQPVRPEPVAAAPEPAAAPPVAAAPPRAAVAASPPGPPPVAVAAPPAAPGPAAPPPAAAAPATPPTAAPAPATPSAAPPPPPGAPAAELRPPKVSDLIHQSKAHEARRPPLPVAGSRPAAPRPGAPAGPAHVVVKGFRCSRNHHNDPRVSFCSVCGIRMDQRTGVLVDGRRPPLGLLVLDIGATFVLDDNYLLGRNPEVDEAVIRSRLRPIRLDDDSGTLSRVHAEIRLEGWDVLLIDRGSANGTFLAAAGQSGWTRLQPHQPVVLAPGMHVRVGRRTFTFESAHARI